MRHSLSAWIALAGTLCLFSCARETVDVRERFSFESTIVVDCAETRTANEGNSTIWVADDAISAIHTDASDPNYYSSRFYYSGANNAFRGSVEDAALVNDWYLVYPYREENTDASKIHVTVGSTATQTGNNSMAHLAGNGYPLIGKKLNVEGRDIQMSMSQVLTLIEVKVANDRAYPITVKEVAVALPYQITGNFVGDLTPESVKVANDVTWTPEGSNATNLTMTVVDGEPIGGDGTEYENNAEEALFYIGTMPFTWKTGDQIKVKVTAVYDDGQNTELTFYKVFTANNDRVFPAGKSDWTLKNTFDDNASNYVDPDPQGPVVKENQELTFANPSLTWTLGDTYAVGGTYDFPQTVDGAKTAVTYTSLNTDIVTIVDNSKIHIVKTGTATIKASAAEDATYNPAEKTYTLTVTEAAVAPSQRTYKYDSSKSSFSSSDAGTYLIMGYESSTSGNSAVGTYVCPFPANSEGKLPHVKVSDSSSITEYTTSDPEIIAYEVELSQHTVSGTTGWVVFVKANNKYLYYDGSALAFTSNKDEAVHTISKGSSKAWSLDKTSGSSTVEFYHSGSNQDFRYRSNQNADNLKLFKLDASKKTQNISFSSSQFTYTLGDTYYVGGTYNLPQVSAVTPVTYSTTNTDVLTISGTTFTILKAGTATITATADETTSYYGATATTKITIEEGGSSNPTTQTIYKKVTGSQDNWAGTYLFVDDNSSKAFAAFSNVSNYAADVTIVTDGTDKYVVSNSQVDKYALTITDAGVQHANATGQEAYDVRNSDGKYIYYSSNALQIADTNSKTDSGSSWGGSWGGSSTTTTYYYYHAFKYNNNGVQVLSSRHDSGSNKYYLGYVSNAFSYSNSSADGRRIQLYKLQSSGGSSSGKQNQSPYFANATVSQAMATASGTLQVQAVQGAQGTVTYSSSESSVATVSGTTITIHGFGSTVITASATGNDSYNPGSASYTLTIVQSGSSTASIYQKASSITVGGTYLIVDVADQRLMKGDSDGSFVSVSPSNGVITDSNNSLSGYEFTVTQSGSKYCIKKGDQYLLCDYSTNGNSTTGLTYVSQEPASNYLYSLSVSNSVFEFSTDQRNSTSTNQVLYYKTSSNLFKIGGSGVGVGVHLYLKTSSGSGSGKQNQSPYFANALVSQTMATASGTLQVQAVQGAQGTVTYSSSESSVATVSGTTITIHGFGSTVITASAAGNSNYNPGSASYTLTIVQSGSSSGSGVYVKTSSLTVGGTYLITDVADQRLFKGASDGSYVSVSPSGGVITDNNGTMSAYEFTVSQSGSKYCLIFNDGKYLICDYSTSGNSNTGLTYLTSKPADNYLYTYTVNNGAFEFKTEQRNSSEQKQNEVLYFKTSSDLFKIGGSGVGVGVHLYLKESGSSTSRQQQSLYFSNSTVNWTLGTDGNVNSVKTGQSVQNAKTSPVTYTSSDSSVATVSGTQITIKGAGTTIITATAPMNNSWFEGTASYTLNILPASGVMVYSLENDSVKNYFNYVEQHPYDPSDYSYSYVTDYTSGRGQNNRLDWPKPVPVSWSNPSTGNGSKVVYIYNNSAMTDEEMHVSVSSSSATSANVYNLIPGHTYYYKVTNNGNSIATGTFMTSGRRRMMNVSSTYNQNNANNCRDLGGQVTTNNKTVKYGLIYRGTNMDSVPNDANAKSVLLDYMKIGLDVDLRERSYNNGQSPLGSGVQLSDKNYNSMGDLTNASNMGVTLNDIFTAVANKKHVYIHCAVGADRTGFVCMVLEGLLGVPQNMCDVDFELTSFSVVGTRQRTANSSGNYYYSGSGGNGYMGGGDKGVTYINNNYSGSTFQEKVTAFVKSMMKNANLSLTDAQINDKITAFQNNMLE